MNSFDETIILCDTPPIISRQKNDVSSEKKRQLDSKDIITKSSLKKNPKKIKSVPQRKQQKSDEKNRCSSNVEELIVLSDEEIIAIEKISTPSTHHQVRRSLRLRNTASQNEAKDKAATSNAAVATGGIMCLTVSDTEDNESQDIVTVKDKSTDSNQPSNDVMVLWSSNNRTIADAGDKQFCDDSNKRVFMVDVSPEPENVICLVSDSEPLAKKHKAEPSAPVGKKQKKGKSKKKRKKRKLLAQMVQQTKINTVHVINKYAGLNGGTGSSSSQTSFVSYQETTHVCNNENFNQHYWRNNVTPGSGALREIIVDGSNIAMAHSNEQAFSERGIQLVTEYFLQRGHSVKVFIPQHRRSPRYQYLEELYTKGIVVFTPSRCIAGRTITPYDDRYILQYATMREGIVVSRDQYRDLYTEKPEWRYTIAKRLLTPTFVDDCVMFPEDPLGKNGPKLDDFLRH